EVVHIAAAEVGLHGAKDIDQVDPLRKARFAVDIDEELRRIGLVDGREALIECCLSVAAADDGVRLPLQSREGAIAAVLDHELEAAGSSHARHGGGWKDIDH